MHDVQRVDTWEPSYSRGCEVCGLKPVVTGLRGGRTVYAGSMCGACYFRDEAMSDPSLWNGDAEDGGDYA